MLFRHAGGASQFLHTASPAGLSFFACCWLSAPWRVRGVSGGRVASRVYRHFPRKTRPATNASFGSACLSSWSGPTELYAFAAYGLGDCAVARRVAIGKVVASRHAAISRAYVVYALASHYSWDMIVAVPWTLADWNALEKRWERAADVSGLAVGWMLLIRFALPVLYASPGDPWVLAAATLATPAVMWIGSVLCPRRPRPNRIRLKGNSAPRFGLPSHSNSGRADDVLADPTQLGAGRRVR